MSDITMSGFTLSGITMCSSSSRLAIDRRPKTSFQDLPGELRNMVYRSCLGIESDESLINSIKSMYTGGKDRPRIHLELKNADESPIWTIESRNTPAALGLGFAQTCHQIHNEFMAVFDATQQLSVNCDTSKWNEPQDAMAFSIPPLPVSVQKLKFVNLYFKAEGLSVRYKMIESMMKKIHYGANLKHLQLTICIPRVHDIFSPAPLADCMTIFYELITLISFMLSNIESESCSIVVMVEGVKLKRVWNGMRYLRDNIQAAHDGHISLNELFTMADFRCSGVEPTALQFQKALEYTGRLVGIQEVSRNIRLKTVRFQAMSDWDGTQGDAVEEDLPW